MKRITNRPSKTVAVSAQALARARGALDAFGVTTVDLKALANFKGDVTTGPSHALKAPVKGGWVLVKKTKPQGRATVHLTQRAAVLAAQALTQTGTGSAVKSLASSALGQPKRAQGAAASGKAGKGLKVA